MLRRTSIFVFMLATVFTGQVAAEDAQPGNLALIEKFMDLSRHTTSSCAGSFPQAVAAMPKGTHITGSCCSPMNMQRYVEQIKKLKKYRDIKDIPPDPYDVDAALAARLMQDYDMALSRQEQAAYNYAMQHSKEKGPCCCKCWHWKAYGGLAKDLIRNYHFTGEQVTEVWNLSDGCGGVDDDMPHHT